MAKMWLSAVRFFAVLWLLLLAVCLLGLGAPSSTGKFDGVRPTLWAGGQITGTTVGPITSTPTFTRATADTEYNSSGQVAAVASGNPAISRAPVVTSGIGTINTGTVALRLSDEVTNLVLNNEVLTAANWPDTAGATPLRTQDNVAAPNGEVTADQIEDDDATTVESVGQIVTVTANTATYTTTVWISCASDGPHTARLGLQFSAGVGCTATNYVTSGTCTSTWQRWELSGDNATCTSMRVVLFPTSTTTSETTQADFWRPQVYLEARPLSVDIETKTTTVTTENDELIYASVLMGDVGSVCSWYWDSDGQTSDIEMDGTAQLVFNMNDDAPSLSTTLCAADNDMGVTSSTSFTARTWHHLCAVWDQAAADVRIYIDAVEVSYSATDRAWAAGCITDDSINMTLSLGGGVTSHEYFLGNFKYWNGRALDAGQVSRDYNKAVFSYQGRKPLVHWRYAMILPGLLDSMVSSVPDPLPTLWLPFQEWSGVYPVDPVTGKVLRSASLLEPVAMR